MSSDHEQDQHSMPSGAPDFLAPDGDLGSLGAGTAMDTSWMSESSQRYGWTNPMSASTLENSVSEPFARPQPATPPESSLTRPVVPPAEFRPPGTVVRPVGPTQPGASARPGSWPPPTGGKVDLNPPHPVAKPRPLRPRSTPTEPNEPPVKSRPAGLGALAALVPILAGIVATWFVADIPAPLHLVAFWGTAILSVRAFRLATGRLPAKTGERICLAILLAGMQIAAWFLVVAYTYWALASGYPTSDRISFTVSMALDSGNWDSHFGNAFLYLMSYLVMIPVVLFRKRK